MKFYRNKFKQIRKQKRYTMQKLADKAKVSRISISIWERGVREPDEKFTRILAGALDISVNEISDMKPEQKTSSLELSDVIESWHSFIENDSIHQDRIINMLDGIKFLNNELNQVKVILSALMSAMHSIFYLKDKNLNYITANNAFLKNFSLFSSYRVAGKKDKDFLSIREAEKNEEEDYNVLLSGKPIINKEDFIPGSRKKKHCLMSKVPVLDSKDRIVGLMALYTDISEIHQLRKGRELLLGADTALHKTVIWGGSFDTTQNDIIFNFASDNVKEITGYSKEFVSTGKLSMKHLVPEQFYDLFYGWMQRLETNPVFEHWMQNITGEWVWCETRITLRKENGKLICIGTTTDLGKDEKSKQDLLETQEFFDKFVIKKTVTNVAKKLRDKGVNSGIISETTGLSLKELDNL